MSPCIVYIFPGQGSQYPQMGRSFYDQFREFRDVVDLASDVLHEDIASLLFESSLEALTKTSNAQPALLIVSLGILKVLEKESPMRPSFYAGHSLGEYSALCASGALSLEDAVSLVRFRGEAMQEAIPKGEGAMAAVLGMPIEEIEEILCEVSMTSSHMCAIANDNAPGQVVISGHTSAVEEVTNVLKSKGARRVIPLSVSGPFHTSLMQPAADRLRERLKTITIQLMKIPVIANVSAEFLKDNDIYLNLEQQIVRRVRWRETILRLAKENTLFVEVGAGKILTGLGVRIAPNCSHRSINEVADLNTALLFS